MRGSGATIDSPRVFRRPATAAARVWHLVSNSAYCKSCEKVEPSSFMASRGSRRQYSSTQLLVSVRFLVIFSNKIEFKAIRWL
ncbi:hypothetical protein L596_011193 [Steinernema carpocapsae]|uniref:Uncharacterized protein n=1 Tax=Steinernema carpocapsae TaxID=34508 RepID=A0A4U5NU28_STECR|nr:hypothetical protein L596_011193 [Steinernema carpocapsae]